MVAPQEVRCVTRAPVPIQLWWKTRDLFKLPEGADPWKRRRPLAGRLGVEGDDDQWHSFEIEKLLERRIDRRGGVPNLQYLVKWKDYPDLYNEWYSRDLLTQNAMELRKCVSGEPSVSCAKYGSTQLSQKQQNPTDLEVAPLRYLSRSCSDKQLVGDGPMSRLAY
ncbi:hypothetical protein F5Y02DRAFT_369094 [Annulohypoxylon stygium]|nr:hypothetical protein F5Y02DRAFT_369094 [Annulohypoxylon stygium]